jgi:hypothetical protein
MKTLWPAATLAIAVTAYFAWSSYSASSPDRSQVELDDCHRLAGEVSAIHDNGDVIPDALMSTARGCAVTFGQNWAATGGQRAADLRAEGAMRVR